MKIEKPGPVKKKHRPKIKPPKLAYCRNCGMVTGTERWCHAESRNIKMKHGGGIMGSKIPDTETAYLCLICDAKLSTPLPKESSVEDYARHEKEWADVIKRSHE